MAAPQTLPLRLIGALFVERGLVSESQIRVALEIQRESGQQLGQVLVERFGVSRKELASVVAEQWAKLGGSSGPEDTASWRRLGEIFVDRGFVNQEELDHALTRQRQTGERLGEVLMAQGVISKFELAGALAEQMAALGDQDAEEASAPQAEATVFQLPTRDDVPAELTALPDNIVELSPARDDAADEIGAHEEPLPEIEAEPAGIDGVATDPDVEDVHATEAEAVEATSQASVDATGAETLEATIPHAVDATGAEAVEATIEASVDATEAETLEATIPHAVDATGAERLEAMIPHAVDATGAEAVEATIEASVDATGAETLEATSQASVDATEAEAVEATIEEAVSHPVEALLTDLRVAIPIDEPSVEEPVAPPVPAAACFVFAPTTEGYRLVPLDGLPEPGATVDIPEVGERVVLRVGPRPIPGDKRLFAFVEEPVTAPVELAVH